MRTVQDWDIFLKSLKAAASDDPALLETMEAVIQRFPFDMKALEKKSSVLFSSPEEVERQTRLAIDLLRQWHHMDHGPSLTALCALAVEHFDMDIPPEIERAMFMASFLGEIPNNLPYHNNLHYRKVLFQALRLIQAYNDIYEGTTRIFTHREIALIAMAACIHDYAHDGKGNTVKGLFVQGRLEQRSFDLAAPYLERVGLKEKECMEIEAMVLCTDVTPLNDPTNPVRQMKAAYRYHFLGEDRAVERLNLDEGLSLLEDNAQLSAMSLILHEADIGTSAGLDYDVTAYETGIYRQELEKNDARPSHIIQFLDQVCQRHLLSDAGKRLYSGNMARIYALAEEKVKAGDKVLPPPQEADFLKQGESGSHKVTSQDAV